MVAALRSAWLAGEAPARDLAVDVATGNGQAAGGLAGFFDRVIATDLANDTLVRWSASPEPDVAGYEVVWRRTTCADWEHVSDAGTGASALLRRLPKAVPRLRASPRAGRGAVAALVVALVAVSAANTAWITPRLDGVGQLNDPLRRAGEWIADHPMSPGQRPQWKAPSGS